MSGAGPGGSDGDAAPPGGRRRRRWGRPVTAVAVAVLAVWAAAAWASLRGARSDAERGLAAVRAAERRTRPADLVEGRALGPLAEGRRAFESAHRRLARPVLVPIRVMPVAGRQLRSATALAAAAAEVARVGTRLVGQASDALEAEHDSGPGRVALLRRMARVTGRAERELSGVQLGPAQALVGPLHDKRAELAARLVEVRTGLRSAHRVADGVAAMLAGPRRYLVLAANNAEMRAGSGMFLSVGELTLADGDLRLGELRPSGDLTLAPERAPAVDDPDLAARWGWLHPNREWRNLGASPRFPANAALAARMWAAGGRPAPEGVLALDPVALRAVLAATGPVTVGGRSVGAADVVELLTHDQYAGITSLDDAAQAARREQLGVIAASALGALQQGDWNVPRLASGLAEAARGRHLLAWSSLPGEQRAWETAGVAGRLGAGSLALAVLNRGGNKLDHFLEVDARLDLRPAADATDATDATLEVTLANRTPEGEGPYVAGPFPGSGAGPGDYVGLLSVNLPGAATGAAVEGRQDLAAAGSDGPTTVVAVPVRVDRGAETTSVVRFRLPGRRGALRVEASARVPAVRWRAAGRSWESGEAHRVAWG